jgi:hypothetical protein
MSACEKVLSGVVCSLKHRYVYVCVCVSKYKHELMCVIYLHTRTYTYIHMLQAAFNTGQHLLTCAFCRRKYPSMSLILRHCDVCSMNPDGKPTLAYTYICIYIYIYIHIHVFLTLRHCDVCSMNPDGKSNNCIYIHVYIHRCLLYWGTAMCALWTLMVSQSCIYIHIYIHIYGCLCLINPDGESKFFIYMHIDVSHTEALRYVLYEPWW